MTQRTPYLACYDVNDAHRLAAALKITRPYALGGQKSAHELFLTPAERNTLIQSMRQLLEPRDDRFALLRLDPRNKTFVLGQASRKESTTTVANPDFLYIG
jgi:CRISPR-associated protein Cas2